MIHLQPTEPSKRIPRHEHRVRAFSRDYGLITGFGDRYTVEATDAEALVRAVTDRFGVPIPDLAFNGRRRHDTGQCWAPRWHAARTNGEERIAAWEAHHDRPYPEDGRIRLGTTTTLRTLGHELGHHLVHFLDPVHTPGHGKVWVGRFDDALGIISVIVRTPVHG
jgi:hypothetical protein